MAAKAGIAKGQPKGDGGTFAIALGGLGGSNAHGVGVLQALTDAGLRPRVLSCTSGMIDWAARWLAGEDLPASLAASIRKAQPWPRDLPLANWATILARGVPGVFRPAVAEYWQRWLQPFDPFDRKGWLDRLAPAQAWVPLRDPGTFAEIADTFNRADDIAILFNSYDPDDGCEIVHVNPNGWDYLQDLRRARAKSGASTGPRVTYEPITADSVRDALWLNAYGFGPPDQPRQRIDGAYVRQFILSELVGVDRIFVARPQAYSWLGAAPQNYFEVQDFQTELWFNAAYAQQVKAIEMVNNWIEAGRLSGAGYRKVVIDPIEIQNQRGYSDYFSESLSVFDHAREAALDRFLSIGNLVG